MTTDRSAPERVEPDVYTDDYYLTNCHGYEDFVVSGGRKVGPRFIKALSLAGDLRGKRVLDVGSGRGELVIQSAMRGAEAWGIDYAQAAVDIAHARADRRSTRRCASARTSEQMDVKALRVRRRLLRRRVHDGRRRAPVPAGAVGCVRRAAAHDPARRPARACTRRRTRSSRRRCIRTTAAASTRRR